MNEEWGLGFGFWVLGWDSGNAGIGGELLNGLAGWLAGSGWDAADTLYIDIYIYMHVVIWS